jgi:hypothetical protein
MLSETCCICGEEAKSPYSYHQHLEPGKLRIYTGHKYCLSLVNLKLDNGEEVRHEDITIPKPAATAPANLASLISREPNKPKARKGRRVKVGL